jgi:hypothetical protein
MKYCSLNVRVPALWNSAASRGGKKLIVGFVSSYESGKWFPQCVKCDEEADHHA